MSMIFRKPRFFKFGFLPAGTKGLSLVETTICIPIVLAIVISMLIVFQQGYRVLRKIKMRTIACYLVQEKLEEKGIWPQTNGTTSEGYSVIPSFSSFRRVVTISDGPVYISDLKRVDVQVFWTGENNVEQSITMSTLIPSF